MSKNPKGFIEHKRKDATYRPVNRRIKDYKQVQKRLSRKDVILQAERCMDCGIPFCHSLGCPVNNLIPEWNDLVSRNIWEKAYKRLELTNSLPEITGRICPAPCETSCTLSINDAPVNIKQIELAIIENAFEKDLVKLVLPQDTKDKRIAVIGSGPAGLAAAWELRKAGYRVSIFEKVNKPGGILRYGIPDFKLEKWVIERRLELMENSGIEFITGVEAGNDISAEKLKKDYDAILLSMGSEQPRDLEIKGRDLQGIYFAMDYLTDSNRIISGEKENIEEVKSAHGKDVLVIGGGDTGSDCIGTAFRQGAKNVVQLEIMPKPKEWKAAYNPDWPDWPVILRTSSSHKEGASRYWSVMTKEFINDGDRVSGVRCVNVSWEKDENGKSVLKELPGTEYVINAGLVLLAMGFLHVSENKILKDLNVKLDKRGNIKTKDYMTNVPSVFAAGDAASGASLVVRAIFQGREAAGKIIKYLG